MRTARSNDAILLVLIERAGDVGGVWRDNDYPGAAAVAVGTDGRVLAALAEGADEIRPLVARLRGGDGATSAALDVVQVRPASARPVDAELRDRLVLFWDPGCGFCASMLADLRSALGAADPDPGLAVVTKRALTAEEAFPAAVVRVDAAFALGNALGVVGTPSALVVDADGTVTSPPAVGADEVLALLASRVSR